MFGEIAARGSSKGDGITGTSWAGYGGTGSVLATEELTDIFVSLLVRPCGVILRGSEAFLGGPPLSCFKDRTGRSPTGEESPLSPPEGGTGDPGECMLGDLMPAFMDARA